MNEKQTQQHRQHFNLSEEAKQKLEELTARRYPGKQRRQSQLVEDLIAEAFAKELSMNTSNSGAQQPRDRLAPASHEALDLAQQQAQRMQAREVYPEHLLLALLAQGQHRTLKALHSLKMDDVPIIRHLIYTMGTWHDVEERYMRDELFKANVTGYNKGGLTVDVYGVRGFVPISQLLDFTGTGVAAGDDNPETELQDMIGRELQLKIIEMNRARNRLILSERLAAQEWRKHRRAGDPWTTVASRYAPGQLVIGTITKIAPFGAFASIEDGVEGLIHRSEFTFESRPHSSFHEGQRVELRITRLDAERRRLSLSPYPVDKPGPVVTQDAQLEEKSTSSQGATAGIPGGSGEKIAFSWELLKCLDRAVVTAQRIHADLVQPEHLLAGVLQNERIQNALTPWLTVPEVLDKSGVLVDYSEGEQTRSSSCPFCGRAVQAHWKHCVYCGKPLARACPKCGTPRAEAEGVRFCFECGSPLE